MGITYKSSGVNINKSKSLISHIIRSSIGTHKNGVMPNIGGFASLFRVCELNYKDMILLTSADGVGTKLLLAKQLNDYSQIGIDLVAMCANDILSEGGDPLLFLDYFSCNILPVETLKKVFESINNGCNQAGCSLVGGELAEMPGMYQDNNIDLAGFMVGVAEEKKLLGAHKVIVGDLVIGLASSGVHANGFSLIRKLLLESKADLGEPFNKTTLGNELLKATTIYVPAVTFLIYDLIIHALAHITGGGIIDNIPRILQKDQAAYISVNSWPRPEIFKWIKKTGNISENEMLRVFNCGIGMAAIVPRAMQHKVINHLQDFSIDSWVIGEIIQHSGAPDVIFCTD